MKMGCVLGGGLAIVILWLWVLMMFGLSQMGDCVDFNNCPHPTPWWALIAGAVITGLIVTGIYMTIKVSPPSDDE